MIIANLLAFNKNTYAALVVLGPMCNWPSKLEDSPNDAISEFEIFICNTAKIVEYSFSSKNQGTLKSI